MSAMSRHNKFHLVESFTSPAQAVSSRVFMMEVQPLPKTGADDPLRCRRYVRSHSISIDM